MLYSGDSPCSGQAMREVAKEPAAAALAWGSAAAAPVGSPAVGSAAFLSITARMALFQQQLAASKGLLCPALHFPNIITAANEQ